VFMSKRERHIALAAIAALVLLVADHYVLRPIATYRAQAESEFQKAKGDMELAESLFSRRKLMANKWNEMIAGGLKANPGEAESQVLHAMRNWAEEAGLTLWSMKPERLDNGGELPEIIFQAAGTGSMSAVSRFLWLAETTSMPLRVKDLQVGSRQEGADTLSLQLRLSTLYLRAEAHQDEPNGYATRGEDSR